MAVSRDTGYRLFAGQALTVLAEINLCRRRTADAVDQARQALAIHRETGHRLGEDDQDKMLGISGTEAQRRFKDLQLYQQVKQNYATTAKKLFGATTG